MAELATELRMSTTTLYNHYPSKEALVRALVLRWAHELAASEASLPKPGEHPSPTELLLGWAAAWAQSVSGYSAAFWSDLRRDYPDAWKIFQHELHQRKLAGAKRLRPYLDPSISGDMALAILDLLITHAPSPELCNRLGISRTEAIETAVRVWAHGALRGRGRVHPL